MEVFFVSTVCYLSSIYDQYEIDRNNDDNWWVIQKVNASAWLCFFKDPVYVASIKVI